MPIGEEFSHKLIATGRTLSVTFITYPGVTGRIVSIRYLRPAHEPDFTKTGLFAQNVVDAGLLELARRVLIREANGRIRGGP